MEIKVPKKVKILTSSHVSGSINSSDTVVIPEGIEEIAKEVFSGSSIKKIVFPQSLKKIGDHAFAKCRDLKEIILPDKLEEIEAYAFYECNNLEYVSLPRTLKKIGKQAFNTKYVYTWYERTPTGKIKTRNGLSVTHSIEYESKIKRILLPPSLKEIGEDAFGYQNYLSYNKNKVSYFVPKNSVAEKFALKQGYTVVQADTISGALMGPPIIGSTFCYAEKDIKSLTIPEAIKKIDEYAFYGCVNMNEIILSSSLNEIGVNAFRECINLRRVVFKTNGHLETIGEYAFGGCENIEEIIIPKSVTEIGDNAFRGCKRLNKIVFQDNSCLKKIGSKAFCDFPLTLIDLPSSLETVTSDAFPKNCIVSIGGEMPLYSQFVSSIMKKEAVISSKGNEWSILKTKLEENHNKLQAHLAACPNQTKEISSLNEELVIVSKDREDETGLLNLEGNELRKVISDTESQIRSLIHERKSCFFLSFSEKRELDEKISNKQNDLQLQKNTLSELISRMDKTEAEFLSKINRIKEKINSLLRIKDDWKTKNDQLISERNQIEKDKLSLEQDISSLKEETEKEKASLQSKHKKWLNERNAEIQRIEKQKQAEVDLREKKRMEEEERKRKEALTTERKRLLTGLVAPECNKIPTYWFSSRGNIIEETALNDSFLRLINATNEKEQANVLSRFVSLHANKIDRVKEINLALGLHIEDGIAQLRQVDAFHISEHCLPERFEKLVKRFASLKQWEQFKQDVCEIIQPKRKNSKNNIQDKFFSGTDYFTMAHENISLLIFPYCMVMYQVGKPLSVLTYNDLKINVEYVDKEEVTELVSDFGELIKEQHMYLNKDGSVSRRYSYNPVVKTIRYTTMTITKNVTNEDVFTFPVKAYQDAMNLKRIFETFSRAITTDLMEKVYGLILHSANLEDIEASIDNLAKEEAIRLEILAKKEAEEKQRLEEERKAAILAAEAKRQEIIQRQRELNEERRRQEEEKKKALQLFEDDFSVIENDNVEEDIDNIDIFFSVIGSMVISNNVFKVVVKQEGKLNAKEYAVSFVSEEDNVISNKKKIIAGDIGCETTLGFVLDSGIDYTKMKKCFMNIETADGVIQRVEFKMNISFYSDF